MGWSSLCCKWLPNCLAPLERLSWDFLAVQCLGLCASTQGPWVWSLVGNLSYMSQSKRKKKKTIFYPLKSLELLSLGKRRLFSQWVMGLISAKMPWIYTGFAPASLAHWLWQQLLWTPVMSLKTRQTPVWGLLGSRCCSISAPIRAIRVCERKQEGTGRLGSLCC